MDISTDVLIHSIESSNLAHTISLLDDDLTLSYVNQAFLDQTGYTREEVIGKNCRFLQGKNTNPDTVDEIRKAIKNFEAIDIEILNYKKDGTAFWNRLRMAPVFDKNNNPVAFIGIQSDVTHIREEERIRAERYKLETLGRVSANISHEIKNAIQPIKLMSETLLDWKNFSEEQTEKCVKIINDNVKIADEITQDVLRFSRKSELNSTNENARELAEDIIRFVKNLLPGSIEFSSEISLEPDIDIRVSSSQLMQIIVNIVNNACYAMNNSGKLDIVIALDDIKKYNSLKNGKYYSISISDSGSGMDEETRKSIFEPFYTTKPVGEGTGLGLSVSQNIVKSWDGLIVCESEIDVGSKFNILLPIE